MPANMERPPRKSSLRLKDDLHVKINDGPAAAAVRPARNGRARAFPSPRLASRESPQLQ